MKMKKCPHCSEENKIYARVCSYCMQTIGIEHKVKISSVGNWVIVFIVVVLYYRLLNEQHRRITNYTTIKT